MIGKVKWFNAEKNFGFVETSDGSDIFVHFSVIQSDSSKPLEKGQKVELDLFGAMGKSASSQLGKIIG